MGVDSASSSLSDFVLTFNENTIQRTPLSSLPFNAGSGYGYWTAEADDGDEKNVGSNQTLDFFGGGTSGIYTYINSAGLGIRLNLDALPVYSQGIQTNYEFLYFNGNNNYRASISDLIALANGGGSSGVTNIAIDKNNDYEGIRFSGSSGTVKAGIDFRDTYLDETNLGRATDRFAVYSDASNEMRSIIFHEFFSDIFTSSDNSIDIEVAINGRTIDFTASGGGGGVSSITANSFLTANRSTGAVTIGADVDAMHQFTHYEDEAFNNEDYTEAFTNGTNGAYDRRELRIVCNAPFGSSYTLELPDPDDAPPYSTIKILVETGVNAATGKSIRLTVPGGDKELYQCLNGNACSNQNSFNITSGVYVLERMLNPAGSYYVWAYSLQ